MIDTLLAPIADNIVEAALINLGSKYSVEIKDVEFIINTEVRHEFQKCIDVALKAFMVFFSKDLELSKSSQSSVLEYLQSEPVTQEIWHLLDPGAEYFDRGKLTQVGVTELSNLPGGIEPNSLFDAWEEFLKAFSFASRSTPHFREFLRASYEAGSFKALSNIEDVLENMSATINEISTEESLARKSIQDYMQELKKYRDWATSFQAV